MTSVIEYILMFANIVFAIHYIVFAVFLSLVAIRFYWGDNRQKSPPEKRTAK